MQRLRYLQNHALELNDEEHTEYEKLREELVLAENDAPHTEIERENQILENNLKIIKAENKKMQLEIKIRKEKARAEKLKNQLDGKIWCDDCNDWKYPSHFKT